MKTSRWFVISALLVVLVGTVIGCSSNQDKGGQGTFAVKLGASRTAPAVQTALAGSDDPMTGLQAVNITLSGVEARRSDGGWETVQNGFPIVVDLLALVNGGGTVTLPPDVLPEGAYTALQIHIAKVELTLHDGTLVAITPPAAGWSVIIPVDFTVTGSAETVVRLSFRFDQSCRWANGAFEFEPEIEVEAVEHGD